MIDDHHRSQPNMKILHITSIINIIVLTISKHHHYPKINLKFIVIIITPIII